MLVKIKTGRICTRCQHAFDPAVRALFSPTVDEIFLHVRAHLAAEALKDEKKG